MFSKGFQKSVKKVTSQVGKKLEELPLRPPYISHDDWYTKHLPKLRASGKYKG